MFSRRGPILIVVSLLLAVAAAWVANRWLIGQTASGDSGANTVPIMTAAIGIPLGTKIEPRHVSTIQMLRDTAPDGAYQNVAAIEGKVALAEIMKGEILLAPRFAEQGAGSTLAAVVSENMRAVSVRVNDVVGVGGFLLPGNRVDVVAAYRDRQDTLSETVVQNVKVLAVDQTASSDKNEPVIVRAVTLEVTPADAEKLILAEQRGSIQLALRNPLDESITKKAVAPVAAEVRVKAPPPAPGVAVIRGTELGKEVPKSKGR
jgi:pilus assembly protein CpaB